MGLNTKQFIDGIGDLMDESNMRVTLQKSATGALICGTTVFVGALIAGPVGIAVGGALGTVGAYAISKGTFKSVGEILRNDLSDRQREKLLKNIKELGSGLDLNDAAVAFEMLVNNEVLKEKVKNVVAAFIVNEMQMHIADK